MKALQYNPLLYYSYYAQMLSALQAQQKLLELNSSGATPPPPPGTPSNNNNNINNNNSTREKLSPLKMPSSLSALKDNNQVSVGRLGDDSRQMSEYFLILQTQSTDCLALSHCLFSQLTTMIRIMPAGSNLYLCLCHNSPFILLSRPSVRRLL